MRSSASSCNDYEIDNADANGSDCAGPLLRRKVASGGSPSPRAVKAAQRDTSQGSPLPAASAAKMGAAFGRDLSNVRVHRDASANQLSAGLRAQAFTRGNDVYFASGKYAPGTQQSDRLLAHEVAHTRQPSRRLSGLSRGGDQAEIEANRAADRVTSGGQATPMLAERPGLSREDEPAPLADRVAAFKRMVLATARLRLQRNRENLQMWASLVSQMQFGAPASRLRTGYQVAHLGSIVLVVVLTAFYSPAEAFTLAFTDAALLPVPTNGGIWVTGYAEGKDCTFTLHCGKAKIRLDLVSTTDRDREFSRPNYFLPSNLLYHRLREQSILPWPPALRSRGSVMLGESRCWRCIAPY